MPLSPAWVDALFARLSVRYGAAFMRQYADIDIVAVKADWADVLGGFSDKPEAIRYGLDNLPPDKAPNAGQFRLLCNAAPTQEPLTIANVVGPLPPAMAEALSKVVAAPHSRDPKAWARRLRDIELNGGGLLPSGDRMTKAQRESWREALANETEAA
jgi:hypothetical protein